jgi:hypothetical protein
MMALGATRDCWAYPTRTLFVRYGIGAESKIKKGQSMNFTLKWSTEEISQARSRYREDAGELKREAAAFESGRKIAAGDTEPERLIAIIHWKSSRPKGRIMGSNEPEELSEALRVATSAKQVRTAVGVLCGLNGVGVPVASAILTAIYPRKYTVIDWRALKALGAKKSWLTLDDYLQYIGFCKVKARHLGLSLRELDHALWILGGKDKR